jgi:hypothetical protein
MGNHSTRENAGSRTSSDLALWRESRLRQAGFDPQTALELAAEKSIDFHELLDLVDRGCPPHLAGRIVAPLESESESR